jgi:hypothetical protein
MAQPGSVPPPPLEPTPFGRPLEPRPARRGCGKPVMIGCGVLLVLLGIAAILLIANARRFSGALLGWSLANLEKQIFAAMPPEVTPEERERLRAAFAAALTTLRSGRFDPQRHPEVLSQVQSEMMQIATSQGKITREDVLDLTRALEAIAAGAPADEQPAGGTEPAPAPA